VQWGAVWHNGALEVVMGTAYPRGILMRPVPVPAETRTRSHRCGLLMGFVPTQGVARCQREGIREKVWFRRVREVVGGASQGPETAQVARCGVSEGTGRRSARRDHKSSRQGQGMSV
jgi:hypothetical protein